MPIYEYSSKVCGHEFETLVLGRTPPECPSCQSRDLKRLISLPTGQSTATRAMSMRAAKKRDKAQASERGIEQKKYEEAHND